MGNLKLKIFDSSNEENRCVSAVGSLKIIEMSLVSLHCGPKRGEEGDGDSLLGPLLLSLFAFN